MQLLSEEDHLQLFINSNNTLIRIMNATDFLAEVPPFRLRLRGYLLQFLFISGPIVLYKRPQ